MTVSDSLANIDAKLERAAEHIGALEHEVQELLAKTPYQTIPDDDPEDLKEFEHALSQLVVPPRLSILAGEVIHQSRSALDHLASDLVRANKGTPTLRTQFPIFTRQPTTTKQIESYSDPGASPPSVHNGLPRRDTRETATGRVSETPRRQTRHRRANRLVRDPRRLVIISTPVFARREARAVAVPCWPGRRPAAFHDGKRGKQALD